MREYKLVFTGPMGVGKTTAIAAISETAPISTDVANADTSVAKATTTVGLDFGQVTLDNGDRLRLYGTPGQARFDFVWKILVRDALGLAILIDNSRPDPLADLAVYLDGFADAIRKMPCALGVSRMSSHPSPTLDDYAGALAARGLVFPMLAVDPRRRDDVVALIETLLMQIEVLDEEVAP
ncbi:MULTISPECIES: GTP-binding protein [unclassified Variovorax]|jgi:signal recognition particle receptor subunit beta|uniref:GTP-binding protein n=1 Tax=unclassified Variovorax TaxID=663243 RepID=UPI000F7DFE47|nr:MULTISPECIES: GTP-binding protein [unclassified Variovorax]RSZ38419.1 GTP-binding protein [Variovorax sp. 553]RSZ39129.1 GTP-binding protein [Variovorax sp. 679]